MKKLIALASAVLATTVLASAAEAGGGVRLGFGFPLGSFTATPSHGGGGSGGYSKAAKRKAPVAHAARKPDRPAPRIAKAKVETTEAPKAVAADKTENPTEDAAPTTGSSALIQGSIPAEAPAADVKAEGEPTTTEPAATASTEQAPDEQGNCKKFVPAIGTTVSVGCE